MENKKERLIALVISTIVLAMIWLPEAQSETTVAKQAPINCGSNDQPCVVKVLPAEQAQKSSIETSESNPLNVSIKDDKGWKQKFLSDPNAIFAGFVAFFTLCLVITAWWQGHLIRQQIKLGRDEFSATHRPKLILRKAYAIGAKAEDIITVQYTIANVGESRAKIIGVKTEAMIVNQSEARLNHIMSPNPVLDSHQGEIFEAAESRGFEHKDSKKWTQDIVSDVAGLKCYFSGRIVYVDESGIKRETVFCRPYDVNGFRFRNPQDQELDYAD